MLGQTVGSYTVLRQIGSGGMGTVFEALDRRIGRRVALKVLHAAYAQHPNVIQRMYKEAQAVNRIAHAGVVQISDLAYLPDGAPYLVMELLEGESLRQRLLPARGPVPPRLALQVAQQVAQVMACAHEHGVIHRDLKPDNVMLVPDAAQPAAVRVKLLDFGIAKVAVETWELTGGPLLTQSGEVLGTPTYLSPEQIQNASAATGKVDVYSLGVVMYEMLAGRPPFRADNVAGLLLMQLQSQPPPLRRFAPHTPEAVAALVHRMLDKKPEPRPSMAQVVQVLSDLLLATAGADMTPDGELQVGSFHLQRPLGPGPHGMLYAAVHADDSDRRAWVVLPGQAPDTQEAQRGLAQRLMRARDPGIVRIYDVLRLPREPSACAIVLEALDGTTLRAYWDDAQRLGKSTGVRKQWEQRQCREALGLTRQLGAALLCAQDEGAWPDDLQMEQVWIVRDRRGAAQVKVFDFGAGQALSRSGAGAAAAPAGFAPAESPGEPRTVYALGALLAELLTGTRPAWPASRPSEDTPPANGQLVAAFATGEAASKRSGATPASKRSGATPASKRSGAISGKLPALVLPEPVPREIGALLRRMLDPEPARRPGLAAVLLDLDRAGAAGRPAGRSAAGVAVALGALGLLVYGASALKPPAPPERESAGGSSHPLGQLHVPTPSPIVGYVPGVVERHPDPSRSHRSRSSGSGPSSRLAVPAAPGPGSATAVVAEGRLAAPESPAPAAVAAAVAAPAAVAAQVVLKLGAVGPGQVELAGRPCSAAAPCTQAVAPGGALELKALPAAQAYLLRWDGSPACNDGPVCTIAMDRDRAITAVFDRLRQVRLDRRGAGGLSLHGAGAPCAPGTVGLLCLRPGATLELIAKPQPGSGFLGWTAGCSGRAPVCRVVVEHDMTIAARFEDLESGVDTNPFTPDSERHIPHQPR